MLRHWFPITLIVVTVSLVGLALFFNGLYLLDIAWIKWSTQNDVPALEVDIKKEVTKQQEKSQW